MTFNLMLDKAAVLAAIIAQLRSDLAALEQAVALARDTATHADCLGSSKYETMGVEASYLAQGQGVRLLEIERALESFRRLQKDSDAQQGESVAPGSLLALDDEHGARQWFWLAHEAGGLQVSHHGCTVMVITPASPLGRSVIGKGCGDPCEPVIAGKARLYQVSACY